MEVFYTFSYLTEGGCGGTINSVGLYLKGYKYVITEVLEWENQASRRKLPA